MNKYISIIIRLIPAVIMLQTLYFKFTGAPESVYIFETLGIEPIGRIGSGIAELIASVLLLIPSTAWAGGGVALGVIGGAIVSHITLLGIEVQGDGGYLFFLALVVFVCSAIVLWSHRKAIPIIGEKL